MNRDDTILSIRPDIKLDTSVKSKEMEQFQNNTLRPILKFQHELTQQLLFTDINFSKIFQEDLKQEKFKELLSQFLKSNQLFKSKLLGTIIGLMSIDEFSFYKLNKKEVEKRIITMQEKRYMDSFV